MQPLTLFDKILNIIIKNKKILQVDIIDKFGDSGHVYNILRKIKKDPRINHKKEGCKIIYFIKGSKI